MHVSDHPTRHAEEARLLTTLQELMALPALELRPALTEAATRVAAALGCEKVDAFLLDEARQTLEALGTSRTPLGAQQKMLGLDTLALANGGRIVRTFEVGVSHLEHHADRDPTEVRGIIEGLGVRSSLSVPVEVNGVRRGVLAAASPRPELFTESDLRFLEIVARWVGALTHRAELEGRARAQHSDDARRRGADEIITVLAHDFRNLLQPLLGRLQLMRLCLDRGESVAPEHVTRALHSTQRLARLTDDLLDLKRLDEGLFTLDFAPVDLAAVARETAQSLGTDSVAIAVTGEPRLVVIGDGNRLRQVLENLVSNAIRYSPDGKAAEVRVASGERDGQPVAQVEVLDAGPGIAPEVLSTLFDRFSSSSDSKGLGLGLHLAHRIARAHRGQLSAHPRPGGGSVFRLELPVDPPDSARIARR
jgi:signal transduction histidine kinase